MTTALSALSAQMYRRPGEVGQAQQQEAQRVLDQVGIQQKLDTQLPLNLTFRDETGKEVRLGDYFGKRPVLITMVYYECPMLCTVMLNELTRSLNALDYTVGKEFEIITVSISPTETPELARKKKDNYLGSYRKDRALAEQGWHFLTGEEKHIKQLADAIGFQYTYDEKTKQYAHTAAVMIATPEGKLARYLLGIEYSARDLKFALTEASQGKIGNPVLGAVMYCFQYDPASGTYGLVVLNVVKLAGIITVLSMALLIGGAVLLERRRAQNLINLADTQENETEEVK